MLKPLVDTKKRFLDLDSFLRPYQNIWNREILHTYPEGLELYPEKWLDLLERLDDDQLYQFEGELQTSKLNDPDYQRFIQEIQSLCQVPSYDNSEKEEFPPWTFFRVKEKKEVEIRSLLPLINQLIQQHDPQNFIDIGGGVGYLAQSFLTQASLPTYCLDQDAILQRKGEERKKRYLENPPLYYRNLKVANHQDFPCELNQNSLLLGLHACGSLGLRLLETAVERKVKVLGLIGCCYFKIDSLNDYNLSKLAKAQGLELNYVAHSLATRDPGRMPRKEFELKLRVKLYRYALHLLLYHEYGIQAFQKVGSSLSRDYFSWDFGDYAKEQLKRLNLKPTAKLEHFYQERFQQVKRLVLANMLRNDFSRCLELYLTYDRALYLEEHGFQTQLYEIFDIHQSPRNLALIGARHFS